MNSAFVFLCILASASLCYSESAPPRYEVIELKAPFKTRAFSPHRIYEDGKVLGRVHLKDRSQMTCLWNAEGEMLAILASDTATTRFGVSDINSEGTVVGWYGPRNNLLHNTAWYRKVGGSAVQYSYPGASSTSFRDINEKGDILGTYSLPGPWNGHSFIFRSNRKIVDLAPLVPNSANTEAATISDDGVIVGAGRGASGRQVPVRWRDPQFPEALSTFNGIAQVITSNGIIAGSIDSGYDPINWWRSYFKGFFLTPEGSLLTEIGESDFLPYADQFVFGMNSSRQIVGRLSPLFTQGDGWSVPFIWSPEWGVFNLNKLANRGARWARLTEVFSINDKGWIIGDGLLNQWDWDGQQLYGGFILKPISTASK